jgi:hypothetical protein
VLRAKVDSLETKRKTVQLAVRELRTSSDLEKQFMDAFPEVKMSMKITSIPVEDAPGLTVQYISVPLRFAETFLIDHQNSSYYKQQRDKLWQLDTLQQQTIALHRKITRLEEEKSAAYKQGYDSAYEKYTELNTKYIELLRKPPQVKFGLPQVGVLAIGAAASFAGGVSLGAGK